MKLIRVEPVLQNKPKLLETHQQHRNITKNEKLEQNIYHSLKLLFIISRIFSILPQDNVFSNPKDMKFRWMSWKFGLALFFIVGHALIATFLLVGLFNNFSFKVIETFVFFGCSTIIMIIFVKLAYSDWSKLITKWCHVDKIMNKTYGYPQGISNKFLILCIAFGVLSCFDLALGISAQYRRDILVYKNNFTVERLIKKQNAAFKYLPYIDGLSATFCIGFHVHGSFLRGLQDLFVILLSIALASRFHQIFTRIHEDKEKEKLQEYWVEIREDFDRLNLLCQELDSKIALVILFSYAHNIFFILTQLFHSLKSHCNILGKVYFAYSFIHLIIKVTTVSLYAAWINDESKEIAYVLNSVPSASYNIEIRRLLAQISLDKVALTVCKMYKITRGLILNLASAVVTYELVLIQFNQAQDSY